MQFSAISALFTITTTTTANPATTLQMDQQTQQKVHGMMEECQKSTRASDVDVQAVKNKKIPTTHQGLCFMECVFDAAKIMKDGKLNKSGAMQALSAMLKGDQAKTKKLGELIDTCDKEVGKGNNDKCVTAKLVLECVQKHGKDSGFQVPMQG